MSINRISIIPPLSSPTSHPSSSSPSFPPSIPSEPLRADCPLPSPFGYEEDFLEEILGYEPRCRLERKMQKWSAAIRSEEGWRERRLNEDAVNQWKKTAPAGLTPAAITYVLEELSHYATLGEDSGMEMSTVDGVWQSRASTAMMTSDDLHSLISFVQHRQSPSNAPPAVNQRQDDVEEVEVLDPFLHCFIANRSRWITSRLSLSHSLYHMGVGSPLTSQQYRGLLSTIQTTVVSNSSNFAVLNAARALHTGSNPTHTTPGTSTPSHPTDLTLIENESSIMERARRRGKIRLNVSFSFHLLDNLLDKDLTVYTWPTALIGDVKADLLHRPLCNWDVYELHLQGPYKDEQTLIECQIHERSTSCERLIFYATEKKKDVDELTISSVPHVSLRVNNDRGIHFTTLHLDDSCSVSDVFQALCEGKGEGRWKTIAMGVPVDQHRLRVGNKWMYPGRKLSEYGDYGDDNHTLNESEVIWERRGDEEVENTVEIEVDLVDRTPAILSKMEGEVKREVKEEVKEEGKAEKLREKPLLVDVDLTHTVKDLKRQLLRSEAVRDSETIHSLHLYLRRAEGREGEELENEKIVGECGVTAGSRLLLRETDKMDKGRKSPHKQVPSPPISPAEAATTVTPPVPDMETPTSPRMVDDPISPLTPPRSGDSPSPPSPQGESGESKVVTLKADPSPSHIRESQDLCTVIVWVERCDHHVQYELPPSTTVGELKGKMERGEGKKRKATTRMKGVPVKDVKLVLDSLFRAGKELFNDRPLSWYCPSPGCVQLRWIDSKEGEEGKEEGEEGEEGKKGEEETMEVQVDVWMDGSKDYRSEVEGVVVDVRPSDTVQQVKEALEAAVGRDYGFIHQQESLFLKNPVDPRMRGKKEGKEEKREEEMPEGKEAEVQWECPPKMMDERTLASYDVLPMSRLFLSIDSVTLTIRIHPSKDPFQLYCSTESTFAHIKRRIAERPDGFPPEWQCIFAAFRNAPRPLVIDDTKTLSQLQVTLHAEVDVLVFRRRVPCSVQQDGKEVVDVGEGMECLSIVVKTETNDLFPMQVLFSEPVACLKWRIRLVEGTPVEDQQRLYFYTEEVLHVPLRRQMSIMTDSNTVDIGAVTLMPQTPRKPPGEVVLMKDDAGQLIGLYALKTGQTVRMERADVFLTAVTAGQPHSHVVSYAATDTIAFMKEQLEEIFHIPRELQHIRLYSLTHTKVNDDATMQETGMKLKEAKSGVTSFIVLKRETPRAQHDHDDAHNRSDTEVVQVQVRLAVLPSKVLPLILLQGENVGDLLDFLHLTFRAQLRQLDPHRVWEIDQWRIECGGVKWTPDSWVREYRVPNHATLIVTTTPPKRRPQPKDEDDVDEVKRIEEEDGEDVKEPTDQPALGMELNTLGRGIDDDSGDDRYGDADDEEEEGGGLDDDDPFDGEAAYLTSNRYAWLPTDFHISADGSVQALSYINNLHPVDAADVYSTLEDIIACTVPLFERVLTSLRHPAQHRVPVGEWYEDFDFEKAKEDIKKRKKAEAAALKSAAADGEEEMKTVEEGKEEGKVEEMTGEDEDIDDEELEDELKKLHLHWHNTRALYVPEAIPYLPPSPPPTIVRLRGRQLQLFVRLLHSTIPPGGGGGVVENPLSSSEWQVDGQRNECIVCSAVMSVEEVNVQPSSISFRAAVCEPTFMVDRRGLEGIFGLAEGSVMVESQGEVTLSVGRCVVYPNVFQHRITAASLVDSTQGGHRTLLLLHMVDPTQRVLSTAHIPPQQSAWWDVEFDRQVTSSLIPIVELQRLISEYAQVTLTEEEAEKYREKAMKERSVFQGKATLLMYQRPV